MPFKQPNYIASRHYVDVAERFLSAGFWNADMTTGEVRGTGGFYRILGLSPDDPFNLYRWATSLQPEDREEFRSLFPVAAAGVTVSREVRLTDRNRPGRWIRVTVEEATSAGLIVGTVQDIAAERASRASLYRERARLDAFLDMTGGIFWARDANGAVTDVRGWSRVVGSEHDHGDWMEAIHPDDRQQVARLCSPDPKEPGTHEMSCRLRYSDGAYRHVVARMVPVRRENGVVIEWLGVIEESWRQETAGIRSGTPAFRPQQMRAARVMLGWSVEELASETGLSTATIRRYETTGDHMKEATAAAIVAAFERNGLVMTRSSTDIGLKLQTPD